MLRCCRSAKVWPSVTMYWTVLTLVASMLGLNTSESTPPATVNHTLEVVLRAVPKQSLRATSRKDWAPGPPGASPDGWAARGAAAAAGMAATAPSSAPAVIAQPMALRARRLTPDAMVLSDIDPSLNSVASKAYPGLHSGQTRTCGSEIIS